MATNENFLELLQRVRNIGIFAHVDAGKTTTTERFLFLGGSKHKIGDVDDANTTTDYMAQERERGITIQSAAVNLAWKDIAINLIDTPGHVDFTMEVERSMRVLDGGIAVLGPKGVEPQTGTVWRQATRHQVPRLVFINKLDKTGANFYHAVDSLKKQLHARVAIIQLPIGEELALRGVVDLVANKALIWDASDETGATFHEQDIPGEMVEIAAKYRNDLIEMLADNNDSILEKFLAEEPISIAEIKAALRADTIALRLFPVLCGSAFKNKGMQPLMDAVRDYLPSPLEVPAIRGVTLAGKEETRATSDREPLAALAFKVLTDSFGTKTFVRVYSGTLKAGERVYNSTQDIKENVSRLVKLQGNKELEIEQAPAGEICAIIGCKETKTGDTLCSYNNPILLETITVPDPVVAQAIEAADKASTEKLGVALGKLCTDDPSFQRHTDAETGQTIIRGMGELHLEVKVRILQDDFGLKVRLGEPLVSYRETIRGIAVGKGVHQKQTGGKGQYGHVEIQVEPLAAGAGFVFEDKTVGGCIPKEFIKPIEKGIRNTLVEGILAGYPIVDIKVVLTFGSVHPVDSSPIAFELAGRLAMRDAFANPDAKPVLLEPIMSLSVEVPHAFMGDIIGDVASRRGRVLGSDSADGTTILKALVPMSTMIGYSNSIRNRTKGAGVFTMEFAHNEAVPKSVAEEIIASRVGA